MTLESLIPPSLLILGAVAGKLFDKLVLFWRTGRKLDQQQLQQVANAYKDMIAAQNASIEGLVQSVGQLRAALNQEVADNAASAAHFRRRIAELEAELADERAKNTAKDRRISDLEREVHSLTLRLRGEQITATEEKPSEDAA